jgi:hypothetical protein
MQMPLHVNRVALSIALASAILLVCIETYLSSFINAGFWSVWSVLSNIIFMSVIPVYVLYSENFIVKIIYIILFIWIFLWNLLQLSVSLFSIKIPRMQPDSILADVFVDFGYTLDEAQARLCLGNAIFIQLMVLVLPFAIYFLVRGQPPRRNDS